MIPADHQYLIVCVQTVMNLFLASKVVLLIFNHNAISSND